MPTLRTRLKFLFILLLAELERIRVSKVRAYGATTQFNHLQLNESGAMTEPQNSQFSQTTLNAMK
jgi:hypothetical protein